MHYTQLFRKCREDKKLTVDELARISRKHRNTIFNVEAGRPIRFETIRDVMLKMGYSSTSQEMRSMGLLWLEDVSGIPFSQPKVEANALKAIATYGSSSRHAARRLHDAVNRSALPSDKIELLTYAASEPKAMEILKLARDLSLGTPTNAKIHDFKAAEDR
jgi:hypothetical protein